MVGAAGTEMDKLYLGSLACTYLTSGTDHKTVKSADVHKFVDGKIEIPILALVSSSLYIHIFFNSEYTSDKLLDVIPGREHPSFPRFRHRLQAMRTKQLLKRMDKYSEVLDAERMAIDLARD